MGKGEPTGSARSPSRDIAEMVVSGELERVSPNPRYVEQRLREADESLKAAQMIRELEHSSITASYDASRFAIDALVNWEGYRVPNRPGAHQSTIKFAEARLSGVMSAEEIAGLDTLRTLRHAIEYPNPTRPPAPDPKGSDVSAAIELARRTVAAVKAEIKTPRQ